MKPALLAIALVMILLPPPPPGRWDTTSVASATDKRAPTASIAASPGTIAPRGWSTLTWTTEGAVRVHLNGAPVAKKGSKTVSLSQTTQYVLIAANSGGTTTTSTTVNVLTTAAPPATTLTGATSATTTSTPTFRLQNTGTDWGARINAVDATLGTGCGTIDAEGGGTIATQIVIGSCHTLYFGPGTWHNSVNGEAILLHDNTMLAGHGWDTIIQESPYSSTNKSAVFIVKPYATHLSGANQVNNITVKNIQFSGVGLTLPPNGSQATVNSGLLNGGSFTNLWFNKTHAIGLTIGESNANNNAVCQNIVVSGNQFTNVGGGIPPNFPGGGGVSLAIVNGNYVTITGNTFTDALGNTMLDIEPNTGYDPTTNIVISGNTFSQAGTTGVYEPNTFGVVTHNDGGPIGPITIQNNTFVGTYWKDQWGHYYPANGLLYAVYVGYGPAVPDHDVTIANNAIKYTLASPIMLDSGTYNDTVTGNSALLVGNNVVVIGHNNQIQGNYVATVASQGVYYFGIEERSTNYISDYNTFLNNQTVGVAFQNNNWIINPNTNPTCVGCVPVIVVGPHSANNGNTLVSRPPFP